MLLFESKSEANWHDIPQERKRERKEEKKSKEKKLTHEK